MAWTLLIYFVAIGNRRPQEADKLSFVPLFLCLYVGYSPLQGLQFVLFSFHFFVHTDRVGGVFLMVNC
jgi:hypothetical protein